MWTKSRRTIWQIVFRRYFGIRREGAAAFAFQEAPLAEAFSAVAAWSQTVLRPENATELMALALKHAIVERDVAHLIFPDEVQTMPAYNAAKPRPKDGRIAHPQIIPPAANLERAAQMLNEIVEIINSAGQL
ncbi:MAG TPA: hypothetical protein ENK32_10740 [Anaerolineae bacterium]|nr:hypothetical protein [Anaerolineae bacterium]